MKSATQQFIEDAIAGGWGDGWHLSILKEELDKGILTDGDISQILLDPLAWQAVGKTRGGGDWGEVGDTFTYPGWLEKQHAFVDQLSLGKTIEEALTAIAL